MGIKRDKLIKIVIEKETKAMEKTKLRAVMVEREYPTNCMAVPLVRHCYGLIKEHRDPWKSRITGKLRKYFPISRRVERRVGKELSRTWHHPAGFTQNDVGYFRPSGKIQCRVILYST